MNRAVYAHILSTYFKSPGVIFSVIAEFLRTLITRVIVVVVLAQMVAAVSVGDFDEAQSQVFIYVILSLVGVIIGAAGILVGTLAENLTYKSLVPGFYAKLTGKDLSFYRDHQTGYLTTIFRHYLDSGIMLCRQLRGEVVKVFVSLVAPIVVLMLASWKLGLLAAAMIIVQTVYIFWASSKANKYRKASHEIYKRITGEVADDITNIVAYKNAGNDEQNIDRMRNLHAQEHEMFWLRRKTVVLLDLPRNFILTIFAGLVFFIALDTSAPQEEVVALLVLAITYIFQIFRIVSDLPDLFVALDDQVTRIYPTLEILSTKHEKIRDPDNPQSFKLGSASIEFKNVNFGYKNGKKHSKVLQDFNLKISDKEHVGIVGLSGAGKSTLANLLMRFDQPTDGSISIGGYDIAAICQADLRKQIAYVAQEPLLFHRSIRENIIYGNEHASEKEVMQAAKIAHADEFIARLDQGYDTVVGERGIKLSGGQKQRIVIARAILKNARILLFDEATSALDSQSEQIIHKALPEIIKNKTAIIIAHRLSTIAHLDRIVVIHDGKVEESGTHQELIARNGRYAALWARQAGEL